MNSVRVETEGLNWRVQTWGDPSLPALVLLHGFTWQGAAWEPIARALSSRFYCVAPDLPGHGATTWPVPSTIWPFERVAEAVWELVERMGLTRVTMVGYSMGGRIAMKCALTPFQQMDRLVLIGASAGLASLPERRKREQDDAELAASLMGEGMEPFLERWMGKPMFAGLLSLPQETREALHAMRRSQDPHGLAASLLTTGVGSQPYLMESLTDCKCPTLLVVGERDEKFRAIASEMLGRLPDGRLELVPDCGHSVPFECPETLCDLLLEFMTEAPQAASLH